MMTNVYNGIQHIKTMKTYRDCNMAATEPAVERERERERERA